MARYKTRFENLKDCKKQAKKLSEKYNKRYFVYKTKAMDTGKSYWEITTMFPVVRWTVDVICRYKNGKCLRDYKKVMEELLNFAWGY